MRADYINENSSSAFGWKKKVQSVGAALTLTSDDSGKVYMCESSGGAFSITLPTAATGENGDCYKFIVEEDTPTADITIAAGSAIINLVSKDAGGDLGASSAGTAVSNIILDTTAKKGDYVDIMYWNGAYWAESLSAVNAGVQTS